MKNILILLIGIMFISCNRREDSTKSTLKQSAKDKESAFETKHNYVIVWDWTTKDSLLVQNNYKAISDEFTVLFGKGAIELTHFRHNIKTNKLGDTPSIIAFYQTETKNDLEELLNNLLISKLKIAKHTIYPIGRKWLGRNTEAINRNKTTNSYISIWATNLEAENIVQSSLLLNEQILQILKLYGEGKIENVFWEFTNETTLLKKRTNGIVDFVFFVNAKTEAEARNICDSLPLSKKNYVTYTLLPAFWLGNSDSMKIQ